MKPESKVERVLEVADNNFWPTVTIVALVVYAAGAFSIQSILKRTK